jgi:hypothetical protein
MEPYQIDVSTVSILEKSADLFKIEARRVVPLGSIREQSQNFRAYQGTGVNTDTAIPQQALGLYCHKLRVSGTCAYEVDFHEVLPPFPRTSMIDK